MVSSTWGPFRSLLALTPILICAPYLAMRQHFGTLCDKPCRTDPKTNLSQISEANILAITKHLSENIGFRVVGNRQHAEATYWMLQQANDFKTQCEQIAAETGRKLECEVWQQEGSGSHRFDMMSKRLYKTYRNLTNTVVRLSNGTPEGKENAVLVNAHLDSTLPSPGAADDAISVAVMLDCMRVLISTPGWSPEHAIVFLFNHAEESLQDASHLFSTQHPLVPSINAVINLEAAGTTRREILFQATSEQMIEAYSHVPRPFGMIFASDIFGSGVILSDTDFRQFELYMNTTGLDMAIVGNSYFYHMRKDLVENIEAGVAQNMGENVLALLRHLSSVDSPLPSLTEGFVPPKTVYFSHLGKFWMYSFRTAKQLYGALFFASVALVSLSAPRGLKRATLAIPASIVCGIIASVCTGVVMQYVLRRGLSWFTNEYSPFLLYGPATMFGNVQWFIGPLNEEALFDALLILQSGCAYLIQLLNIGSAAMYFIMAVPTFAAVLTNRFLRTSDGRISLWAYAIGGAMPLNTGVQLLLPILEVFTPLSGRMGGEAPADLIIAVIVAVLGTFCFPLALPFAHRYGRKALTHGILYISILLVLSVAAFSMKSPFDANHQKRVFVIHSENMTSHEESLNFATSDGAPKFEVLARDIAQHVTPEMADTFTSVVMDDYNSEWNVMYPFSAVLSPYRVNLPVEDGHISEWNGKFTARALNETYDPTAGTRSLTIEITHPGLIWTVIAFDAHVLLWSLDDAPPDHRTRHIVKEASSYGIDTWTVDLTVLADRHEKLRLDLTGIDWKAMWPAERAVPEHRGRVMQIFEELDPWLDEKTNGAVDALMLGCVSGVVLV
ncbi:hypothetical protein FISHEDRAFT_36479 [Fistulina hepatica ATCC 64428]|uniref:Peptide hydrolase n=1 Tax=Fistulina hepatica ATCC 64428 TaxID=1128425 RepID=A0A0D7ALU5_9AGAR|nr:hypothetical protein FISHEDRAFT_36479 [Fistulina hepatica ATCC 64428]